MSRDSRDKSNAQQWDLINRGSKRPSPLGTLTFVGLRILDLPWQYHLLHNGGATTVLSYLGLSAITSTLAAASGAALTSQPDLPAPGWRLLFAMATGSTLKQIFWQTYLSQEEFPPKAAAIVATWNTVINTANSLFFVCAATSSWLSGPRISLFATELPLAMLVGTVAYAAGITIETLSEYQRLKFKRDPNNQGKVCKVGLWRWARHINYFGYSLWRGGYCMVASGWLGGIAMGLFLGFDFTFRAIKVLDQYCGNKYGQQWTQFRKEVPYQFVPGVY